LFQRGVKFNQFFNKKKEGKFVVNVVSNGIVTGDYQCVKTGFEVNNKKFPEQIP